MDTVIKEYQDAVNENIQASLLETASKEAKKKAHYRLIKAKEAMRAMEYELLTDPTY